MMPDTKASILIVDDRPEKLLALEAVLEDLNQHIVRAYSGREALRHVLDREFAVILLDVNMPGMDGFETASLIRQRKSSQHVPIIFITAFGDEMHAARGYSLGAVDYILAPVVPEVLRTKVAVFVDLYRKTEQTRRQAESLRRRATQLQKLAAASTAINGATSMERMLQTITDTARDIVGAHQAITLLMLNGGFAGGGAAARNAQQVQQQQQQRPKTVNVASFSDKYAHWRGRPLQLDRISTTLVAQSKTATRLTQRELHEHPDWEIVQQCDVPPVVGGMLAAPLTGHDASNLGVIYLAERYDDEEFTNDDEAILVQLAQMASIAIENILFAEEREANRLKDEFLATLSHELRTPLNAILGWTQLLKMEGENGENRSAAEAMEEVAHGLEVIERNARSQTKLIEDLLDVSRITTGKLRLSLKPVELALVVRAAVDGVRPVVESKQITLTPRIDAATTTLSGDPDRLQQVFWNLLSNAAKFTPQSGRIDVTLADSGTGAVTLSVRDSGAGIDPKFLPYVFDRFRQADSSSTRSHGGLGIGLTIVRHIVELHGGSVAAHSEGEGRGSTFTVTLPLAAPAAAAVPASQPAASLTAPREATSAPVAPVGGGGNGAAAPAAASTPPTSSSSSRQPIEPVNLGGVRVLLVDDEPDAREVISQILRRCGALVKTAGSAREALNVFGVEAGGVDVLVSDIAMPDEDGYCLIRELRGRTPEQGGTVPAVALTAYAREEDRQRALQAGFQSHLAKPVEPCDLAQAIASLAGNAKPRHDDAADREERPVMRLRLA